MEAYADDILHYLAQIFKEKEIKYLLAFNYYRIICVYGCDVGGSARQLH